MVVSLPETIGRYLILRRIGAGGMGTLFLARDPAIDRLVAVKLLRQDLDHAELRERFMREARSVGRLSHVNIVTIFDVGEHEGQPFITMELIQGETLADLVKRRLELSLSRKLVWMDELCAGLHYAHRAGIVHRDIKPANIMIDHAGVLKILDFGIARLGASEMTQAGMVLGTLSYMAPEQMEGKPVDARADIYSAGAVFYELLSFRRAFPGDIEGGAMHRILSGTYDPLETVCPDLDVDLVSIVKQCLERDPMMRHADLDTVRRKLARVRQRLAHDEPHDPDSTRAVGVPPNAGGAGAIPAPKQLRRDSDPNRLLRVRAEQVRKHLERAQSAFDRAEYDAVLEGCVDRNPNSPPESSGSCCARRQNSTDASGL